MEISFEWNTGKAFSNYLKHKISFEEAKTVFSDQGVATYYDTEHSDEEERFISIGLSEKAKLLTVVHTERNYIIRVISARKATRSEIDFYNKKNAKL